MDKKIWLQRTFVLDKEIKALIAAKAKLIPGENIDKKALEASINNKLDLLFKSQNEIYKAIEVVQDGLHRAVLINRYISHMTWESIAEQMSYSVRGIHRLHGAALAAFIVP